MDVYEALQEVVTKQKPKAEVYGVLFQYLSHLKEEMAQATNFGHICPECKERIFRHYKMKFCYRCGKAIKFEEAEK